VNALFAWLRRNKSAAATVVALFVVWRVARAAIGGAWVLAGWDDVRGVGEWALEHWIWFGLGLAVLFLVVFFTVRAVIPWLDDRARKT
jgi:hypothetical protein